MDSIEFKNRLDSFSWKQLFNNNDGKTSITALIGFYLCVIGGVCFIFGCIDACFITHKTDIMMYSFGVISAGATLLGARKLKEKGTVTDHMVKLSDMIKPKK